jgi:hypothetical protein
MGIDRARLAELLKDEQRRFRETHPRSAELFARASESLLGGVPMTWMRKWAGGATPVRWRVTRRPPRWRPSWIGCGEA